MLTPLCLTALALAAGPALLFLANLRLYRAPAAPAPGARPGVSVLIPARNEEASIRSAVAAALASDGVDLELIVLDDHSTDATAATVRALAAEDPRLRLHQAPALPPGWCGKQHACQVLAGLATKPVLAFLDADVRLAPDGLARLEAFLDRSGADLVSGFPRQEAVTPVEQLVIPLIHFVLLGFLPLGRMRASGAPALGAGCGQLFLTKRSSYERMGGHAAIRASLHDGLQLPRAYRAAGLKTDLCDATGVATCRMYRSASEVWQGLAKNAGEALAAPTMIVPATVVLLGGQVLPVALLLLAVPLGFGPVPLTLAALATVAAYLPRVVGVFRFCQPRPGALLHPLGVTLLVAIQWYALARDTLGRPATWKGRPYPARAGRAS